MAVSQCSLIRGEKISRNGLIGVRLGQGTKTKGTCLATHRHRDGKPPSPVLKCLNKLTSGRHGYMTKSKTYQHTDNPPMQSLQAHPAPAMTPQRKNNKQQKNCFIYECFNKYALHLFHWPNILLVTGMNCLCVSSRGYVCLVKGGGTSLPWERVVPVPQIENHYKQLKHIKEKMHSL